jgi:hypothetical protein
VKSRWLGPFFVVSAIYDGVLGLAFLFFWPRVFQAFGVPPPNHPGYVQFPGLLLITFGLMFLQIARDPRANRNLIPFGIGLKLSYAGLVFWFKLTQGIPGMWMPWAWADLVFLALLVVAWRVTAPSAVSRVD